MQEPSSTPTPQVVQTSTPDAQQKVLLELVSQLGGATRALAVRLPYAYLGIGPRLAVYDVSQPEVPSAVGQSGILPGVVEAVVLNGDLVYVAAGHSIFAFDVSDPNVPLLVGDSDALDYEARSLAVADGLAFVGGASCEGRECTGLLWTMDISDPSNLQVIGLLNLPGIPRGVVVVNQLLYIALSDPYGRTGGIALVDFSNPQAVEEIGSLNTGNALSVAVSGQYAYLGDYDDLRVIDVADPSSPVQVGYMLGGPFDDIVVIGDLAFVARRFCEFEICYANVHVIDVSDPTQPVYVDGLPVAVGSGETASGHNLAIAGDLAFFAADERMEIFDISDAVNFHRGTTRTLGRAEGVSVNHGIILVFVSGSSRGLHVLDVQDQENPTEVGTVFVAQHCEVCASLLSGMDVQGQFAYLSVWNDGFRTIDVSDPNNPVESGSLSILGDAYRMDVEGDYVYLADRSSKLRLIDISDPSGPREVSVMGLPGSAYDVVVSGSYGYVIGRRHLNVIDVQDPTRPKLVGSAEVEREAQGIDLAGNYVYVVTSRLRRGFWSGFLQVLDVSDPAHPRIVSSLEILGGGFDVTVSDGLAYVAGTEGISVVDIREPTSPREVGWFDTPGSARAVAVSGGYVYVADGDGGLVILRISDAE